jgi:diguanylate cyclase (GGDEF)-like protein
MSAFRLSALALALCCVMASSVSAQTSTSARWVAGSLEDRIDRLVREGFERPGPARTALERLRTKPGLSPRENITVLYGLATVELQVNRLAEARAIGDQMTALARDASDSTAAAVALLVQGLIADTAGNMDEAAASAQAALGPLQQACNTGPVVDGDCDYRSTWRSLRLLERRSTALGAVSMARAHEKAALAVAARAGDLHRQAMSLGRLAVLAQRSDEPAAVQPLLQQAFRLADASGDAALQARTRNDAASASDHSTSTHTSTYTGKADMLRYRQEALAFARKAGEPRLEALMLTNLSDAFMRLKQPAEALQAGQQALAIVRGLGENLAEPAILINNIGIAKIGLGRIDAGKQDLADVLEIWKRRGDLHHQVESLREYGEALAAAGDAHTALQLYHQEREISARLVKANGEAALKELRLQNDAEAKQRSIELIARDNALKTEQLANGELRQRLAWLVGVLMCLSIGLVGLLYRRVREINRRLSASHAKLRMQSERDTLTGLANRRHVHATLQSMSAQREAGQGFEGTLLLVDVDHFKQVNDRIGHTAGDQVLVEVARRLTHATRRDDLVARWGGEEFLILVPKASAEQVDQLAARVLEAVSGTPIEAEGRLLRVTASIGYARFPLPPHAVPLSWEQAINLVDLALYIAKSEGRHRAIGITASSAASVQALQAVEADFDRARHDGWVTLVRAIGVSLPIAA